MSKILKDKKNKILMSVIVLKIIAYKIFITIECRHVLCRICLIGGDGKTRSKNRVCRGEVSGLSDLPVWNNDVPHRSS